MYFTLLWAPAVSCIAYVLPLVYIYIYIYIYPRGVGCPHSHTNRGVLVSFNDFSRFSSFFQPFSTILNAGNTPAVPRQYHGVSGSSGAVFGGPEAKHSLIYTMDLGAICIDWWASALHWEIYSPIQNHRSGRHLYGLVSISTP